MTSPRSSARLDDGGWGARQLDLSDWTLRHRRFVWCLIVVAALACVISYLNIGRSEGRDAAARTMVIQVQWPGASVEDTTSEVTDRIERSLDRLDGFDHARSMTSPGRTTVFVSLKNTVKARDIQAAWTRLREMIAEIGSEFPNGVVGPSYSDDVGGMFGNIYAFTADGISARQLRDYVADMSSGIRTLPDVGRVDLIGAGGTNGHGPIDPSTALFHYNGVPAIGLSIGIRPGADIVQFGEELRAEMTRIEGRLPVGFTVNLVARGT